MSYKIRLATLDDVENLVILKRQMWDETYRGIYYDEMIDNFNYNKSTISFTKRISDPDCTFYVVEDNKLVGYICFGVPYRNFEDYTQDIGLLYLTKEYQKRGIGRQLFDIAYNKMKNEGHKRFFIACNKYNHNARRFYEKMGGKILKEDEDNQDKSLVQVYYHYCIK